MAGQQSSWSSQHEPAQMESGQPLGPSPMTGRSVSSEPQIARSQSFGVHPMSGQTQLGSPQMTGQPSLGSHNRQQPSEFHNMDKKLLSGLHNMDQQHPLRPYQGNGYPIKALTSMISFFFFFCYFTTSSESFLSRVCIYIYRHSTLF